MSIKNIINEINLTSKNSLTDIALDLLIKEFDNLSMLEISELNQFILDLPSEHLILPSYLGQIIILKNKILQMNYEIMNELQIINQINELNPISKKTTIQFKKDED